jgi:hypothetical protein
MTAYSDHRPKLYSLYCALMKISGRYGNRDLRQDGSVHRKSAQIADDVTD